MPLKCDNSGLLLDVFRLRGYDLHTTPARHNPIQMDRGRAHWDDNTTRIFLDLCIAEKEKQNYNSKGLTKIGWNNLYRNFKEETRRVYDSKQLQNKFNSLKRMYNIWRQVNDKTRGGWDKNSSTITQDADGCDNQIAENSAEEEFRGKALAHEDALTILFGSMDGKDSTKLCFGGTGDRTPSGGGEDNRARVSEDNTSCPEENVGRYRVGRVSQWSSQEHMVDSRPGEDNRARMSEDNTRRYRVGRVSQWSSQEHMVDSRPTKRSKNTGYYGEPISESMLDGTNESNAIRREQEEVIELLQLVEKDGVSQGSELFFIATELFRSPIRRAAFRCITTPKNRIAWLRWTWDNVKM